MSDILEIKVARFREGVFVGGSHKSQLTTDADGIRLYVHGPFLYVEREKAEEPELVPMANIQSMTPVGVGKVPRTSAKHQASQEAQRQQQAKAK